VFAVDYAEIRLPLTNRQTGFIDLPEDFRDAPSAHSERPLPPVSLSKQLGNETYRWEGKIVRTEGAIDASSRQLFVIAQVDDPYGRRDDGTPPLKIGDFVEAEISGKLLEGVYTIPRTALRGGQALIIDGEQRLRIRDVTVVWGDTDNVVVTDGLKPGEIVCTTPPAYATDGALVSPIIPGREASPQEQGQGGTAE
jgi:multidrug efflux system membrane fusion protein